MIATTTELLNPMIADQAIELAPFNQANEPKSMVHACPLNILLIDDDRAFGKLMQLVALDRSVCLDYRESLIELGSIGFMGNYDLVLCDYYLHKLKGSEVAEYLDIFFGSTPLIMISASPRIQEKEETWPACVRGFIQKQGHPRAILDGAIELAGLKRP